MSQSLLISVVIPCRGHAEVLSDCLHAVQQQETPAPYEVIVVDSAADPAVARVAERFAGVRLLRHEGGLLAGEARNLGVEAACGEYLAFTDADCTPERGWLRAALDALQGDARLVGGPIGDALPLHPVAVSDNLLQFADFAVGRPDGEARNIPACNMAVSRLDFVELGGFVHWRGLWRRTPHFAPRRWSTGPTGCASYRRCACDTEAERTFASSCITTTDSGLLEVLNGFTSLRCKCGSLVWRF